MTASVGSSKQKWREFFQRYYKPRLQELAVSTAKTKSLVVDFQEVVKYDFPLSEELLNNPGKVLKDAEDAVPMVDLPVKRRLAAFVRIVNLQKKTLIRDVRNEHVNTLASIDCTVRNITGVSPRIINAAFECARCGNIVYLPQEGSGKFLEPAYCSCNEEKKGVFRLLYKESIFEDYQRIKIQEGLESLDGGEQPQTLECNLNNDLSGQLNPGDRVVINGILRSVQKINKDAKTVHFAYYVDVNSYERDKEELDELVITAEDEAIIRALAARDDVFVLLERSIAPSVYGHEHVKKAVGLQLFGSKAKYNPDGTRVRGDIHILWLGDPGVAKSQILAWTAKNAPRGLLTSGQATGAGLIAATVPSEFSMTRGVFELEAGAMALACKGVCCIDEFDKMRRDDRVKIHMAMEQQSVPIDRAGIHATIPTDCSVLAAGNPKLGRFDPNGDIPEQINLDPAIFSRFDLAYMSYDTPDEKMDKAISKHILDADMGVEEAVTPDVDALLLKKWIALAKRTVDPELSEGTRDRLQQYYLKLRKASENSSIKVTARSLNGLTRLCKAAARVTLLPVVENRHVDMVLELVNRSVRDTCIDENGEVDIDTFTAPAGRAQRERIGSIRNIIKALTGNRKDAPADIEQVIEECGKRGMDEEAARKELKRLKEIGEVYHPREGEVALT